MLLVLPMDILLDILNLMPRRSDLCNLALVCSRFKDPAQQVLYRSIYLGLPGSGWKGRFWADGRKITRLIDTLSENVQLRMYVSNLSVKVFHSTDSLPLEDYERLLSLVPRLESLSLDPNRAQLQLSEQTLPSLNALSLTAHHYPVNPTEREDPLEIIARHFWVPHMRKIYISETRFTPEMSVLFPPDRHRTAPITDLQFCDIGSADLGCLPDVISCVRSLRRFTLEVFSNWEDWQYVAGSAMPPEIFGQLLRVHASTLAHLEIAGSDAGEFPCTSLIGSLAGYPRLERLALPEPFLVVVGDEASTLVDVLPPNLRELQLQFPMLFMHGLDKDRATRIRRLEQVAAAKPVRFHALQRVIWWSQPAECCEDGTGLKYGPISDMDHLTAAFKKVGVIFEWFQSPYFECTPFRRMDDEGPPGNPPGYCDVDDMQD